MFYCQHILGIGHLIRSIEIVRGLIDDFQIYFINGGKVIEGFPIPANVEVINLPAIETDSEFRTLRVSEEFVSVEAALDCRKTQLLDLFDRVHPDVLTIELFPFGRRRFSTELLPLLEIAKASGTRTICSLRDIVVTKQDRERHEAKICKLMNRYFDVLLVHGDPKFIPLETSFSRVNDLNCDVYYTGYVVQKSEANVDETVDEIKPFSSSQHPMILVSVGGGRFGHELLECVARTARLLEGKIPHRIQLFTGPFAPNEVLERLQQYASQCYNLTVDRYTPNFLNYMRRADLSISMAGYNTTLNVLTTGVRAMLLPFQGNDDREQTIRSERLEELGVVRVLRREDLEPEQLARKIVDALQQQPHRVSFDLQGVEKTAQIVRSIQQNQKTAA